MVATFVERSRKIWNVNDGIEEKKQTNFVKMLFCKNDNGYINFATEQSKPD